MRTIIVIVAVAVSAAFVPAAEAGWGSFVSSFESPGPYPAGISYKSELIYVSTHNLVVWRLNRNGSVVNSYYTNVARQAGMTVGTVGGTTYYWVVPTYPAYVYRFVDNSSTMSGSFSVPSFEEAGWRGLAFKDAAHMYYTDGKGRVLYMLHPMTGSVYASYSLPFRPNEVAYDDRGPGYLWMTCADDKSIYQCRLAGSVVASFSVSAYGYPQGCGFDGEYLWVGCGYPTQGEDYVVQFDVRSEPVVEPASIGKVKALYR